MPRRHQIYNEIENALQHSCDAGGFTAYVVNNLRLAMGGVADELNTVGGAFTIDGEKTSSATNVPPSMVKNPPRVIREIYNK